MWAYKVDTDEQVQGWSPDGWADYEWVVSTASMRANMPPDGVLTEAVTHAQPAATFGSGGTRVDVLRVDNGAPTSKPTSAAAPAFGGQLAAGIAGATDPDVLAILQSRMVDQRVIATLAVVATTQPVRIEDISAVDGEDDAGTPLRQFTLSGPPDRLQGVAAFFERQVGPFAVQSADLTANGLEVRFPLRTKDIGLSATPAPGPAGHAALRVADLRRNRPTEQLNLVRIDGTAAGSLEMSDATDYRSLSAGTYVVVTNHPDGVDPVIRQVITIDPGVNYTLALFSAGATSQVTAQLAPDGPSGPGPDSAVRMLDAASAAAPAYVALVAPGMVDPMVLANQAGYGLITGYAPLPAGRYDAVLTANGREWRQPVEFPPGEPTTLLLTDGPDGPRVRTLRDVPDAPADLGSPGHDDARARCCLWRNADATACDGGSDGRRARSCCGFPPSWAQRSSSRGCDRRSRDQASAEHGVGDRVGAGVDGRCRLVDRARRRSARRCRRHHPHAGQHGPHAGRSSWMTTSNRTAGSYGVTRVATSSAKDRPTGC